MTTFSYTLKDKPFAKCAVHGGEAHRRHVILGLELQNRHGDQSKSLNLKMDQVIIFHLDNMQLSPRDMQVATLKQAHRALVIVEGSIR